MTDIKSKAAPSQIWRKRNSKALAQAKGELFRTEMAVYETLFHHYPHVVEGCVLDPSAGDGRWISAVMRNGNFSEHMVCDINPAEQQTWQAEGLTDLLGPENCVTGNWLAQRQTRWFDCMVTNPPFSLSIEFVEKALQWVRPGGFVTVLQRANWIGTQERSNWFRNMPLYEQVVIPYRVAFTHIKDGKEQKFVFAYEFCLYTFRRGHTSKPVTSWLYDWLENFWQ